MIVQLLSILFVLVLAAVVALAVAAAVRGQRQSKEGLRRAAGQLGYRYLDTAGATATLERDLSGFELWRGGGRPRVQAVAGGRHGEVQVRLAYVTFNWWGASQNYTEHYIVALLEAPVLSLPRFSLSPRRSGLRERVDAAVAGGGPEISLAPYSELASRYRLTGEPEQAVAELIARGLAAQVAALPERAGGRGVEAHPGQLLLYHHLPASPSAEQALGTQGEALELLGRLQP